MTTIGEEKRLHPRIAGHSREEFVEIMRSLKLPPPKRIDGDETMCMRVKCNACGKPTFAGCGAHIEQVLGNVPKAERCRCGESASKPESAAPARKTR